MGGCAIIIVILLAIGFLASNPEAGIGICVFIAVVAIPAGILDANKKRKERNAIIAEENRREKIRQEEEHEKEEKEARWEEQILSGKLPIYASLQEQNRNSYFVYFGVHKEHDDGYIDIVSTPYGNAQDALIMARQLKKRLNASDCRVRTDHKSQGYIVYAARLYAPALMKYKSVDGYIEFENPTFGVKSLENNESFVLDSAKKYSSGAEFEHYVAERLKEKGFKNVGVTKASGDFGADIIAECENKKVCFQCKFYHSPVGISAVQEVIGAKKHYKCDYACVITNSTLTDAAKQLALENDVDIIENFT